MDALTGYLQSDINRAPPVSSASLVDRAENSMSFTKENIVVRNLAHELSVQSCYSVGFSALRSFILCLELGEPSDVHPARFAYNIQEDVEFRLGSDTVIGDHKSPAVFEKFAPLILALEGTNLGFNDAPMQIDDEKSIVFKLGVSLAFHKGRYGFIHCMTKWLFFELYRPDPARQPILFVSDVVNLDNQDTPVSAILVAMMLVTRGSFSVPSPPLALQVPTIPRTRAQMKPLEEAFAASQAHLLDGNGGTGQKLQGNHIVNQMLFEKAHPNLDFVIYLPEYEPQTGTMSTFAHSTNTSIDQPTLSQQILLRFDGLLARGAQSTVYKATIFPYQWSVVVKISPRDPIFKEWGFYRGPLNVGTLNGIPTCIGGYALRGGTSAILILSDVGETLKTFSELDRAKKMEIYRVVCDIHDVGIIHNDICPPNTAISPDGEIHLLDFGFAEMHVCTGQEGCKELIDVKRMLELGSK